jgi:glyoxylase-like metal-dependent hydrolase (beta-lactamase superfamily II)
MCLLHDGRYLFTGDHLWWNREHQRLGASRAYNWYSWPKQIESMRLLANESFEWVLPGHGQRVQLNRVEMQRQMHDLVERMSQNSN